ncbi:FAD-dependent oxidoreductase [Litoribrevibacter albus]|uniref:Monooxygenase n=1 Tax=Litoribrevibacter albus TaxID=1473156 RepID=A0AA37S7Y5_9GAMM|nr:FAD-dependent oxidoreductase [Litoribrevibacter albus]GLQ29979.1 monooxygenase [Litoribrevibacter albus]
MDVIILGGGVAGVSTAIALKQNGFNVRVFERHKVASTIGAGVVIWPNAAYVLEQLGVLNQIEEVSGRPKAMRRVSSTGEPLGAMNLELINSQMGYESFSILRRDLQEVLISKLESLGVEIEYGKSVVDICNSGVDKATVCLVDPTGVKESVSADVIIGAEGRMASQTRTYVLGDNQPVYQGFINWIGVYESNSSELDTPLFDSSILDYWGVGERFGIVPVGPNKAYWAGGIASKDIGTRNPEHYKDELTSIFSEWPEPVRKVIEGTPVSRINKVYVHDHDPAEKWHKNNVIMIGDAAHAPLPTSGQGACQALEDAIYLAQCLRDHQHDISSAFEQFTASRFQKTTSIIMAARGLASSLFNPDPQFCHARNESSKQSDFTAAARGMAQLWGQGLPLTVN